jgi:hypothetical protein
VTGDHVELGVLERQIRHGRFTEIDLEIGRDLR